jgi:hypothetical protein
MVRVCQPNQIFRLIALPFAALGVFFLSNEVSQFFGVDFAQIPDLNFGWGRIVIGLACCGVALGVLLYRRSLELDSDGRAYRWRHGFFGLSRVRQGTWDDFTFVAIDSTVDDDRLSNRGWVLRVVLFGKDSWSFVCFKISKSNADAAKQVRREALDLAEFLDLCLTDLTSGGAILRVSKAVEANRAASGTSPNSPLPASNF